MNVNNPIVDASGKMVRHFRQFINEVERGLIIIGQGSPEGVVEARQGQEYMDENGAAGSVKWIKQQADIGGNRKQGWVAIG